MISLNMYDNPLEHWNDLNTSELNVYNNGKEYAKDTERSYPSVSLVYDTEYIEMALGGTMKGITTVEKDDLDTLEAGMYCYFDEILQENQFVIVADYPDDNITAQFVKYNNIVAYRTKERTPAGTYSGWSQLYPYSLNKYNK